MKNITSYAQNWQKICLKQLPQKGQNLEIQQALNCGAKIEGNFADGKLAETSLLHFFLISGTQFILFDELLSILAAPVFVRFLVLSVLSLLSGWQPAVVRILCTFSLRQSTQRFKIFLPADLVILAGGLLLLFLFPAWWKSEGLLLGWCAALAFCIPQILHIKKKSSRWVCAQVALLIFISVPLSGLTSIHPLGMVFQLLLSPFITYLLLPLSLLSFAFPFLVDLFDSLFAVFQIVLQKFSEGSLPAETSAWTLSQLWWWMALLHIGLHFLRIYRWQGRDTR